MTQAASRASASVPKSAEGACPENPFVDIDELCTRTKKSETGEDFNNTEPGCEYYRMRHNDFLERHRGDGLAPPDYYLNYGEKYCNKFTQLANNPDTPADLRDWALKTRCELQKALEAKWSEDLELLPDDFKAIAFDTHCGAYQKGGLLELDDVRQWLSIFGTVDIKDLFSVAALHQAAECGGPAAKSWLQNRMREVSEADRRRIELYMEHGGLPPVPVNPGYPMYGGGFF